MVFSAVNVTGWNLLLNASIIRASFSLYDEALVGWTIAILFIVYEFMLIMKTGNLTTAWVIGLIFASLYVGSSFVSKPYSLIVIFMILVFELAGILYYIFWKD